MDSENEFECDARCATEDALDGLKQMSPTDYHFCVVDADSESHEYWGLAFDGHNWRGGASKGFGSQAIKFASSVY